MRKGKKISKLQIIRILIQIAFFILVPGLYASAFSGIKRIYTGILEQSFSFSGYWPQLIEAIAVIPVTILLGRFFCGWMCAFGSLGDLLYQLSSRIFKVNFKIDERADRILKYLKYVILGFIVIVIWSFDVSSFSSANPWNVFGLLATVGKLPDFSDAVTQYTLGLLLLLAIMTASLFIERFFCRYLCPLGAVFAIVSRLRFMKIKKPNDKCGACRVCTKSCPMGIPLYKYSKVDSGECIHCLKCVSDCPRNNVSVSVADADVRPVIAGALAVTVISGFYYGGSFAASSSMNAGSSAVASSNQESSNKLYKDGTYEGSGEGFRGATTTVNVTLKNDKMTNIEVVSFGDDGPYFNAAYSTVVNEILSKQSAEVDACSGATFSSMGIMSAVADALNNARISSRISLQDEASAQNETTAAAVDEATAGEATVGAADGADAVGAKAGSATTGSASASASAAAGSGSASAASPDNAAAEAAASSKTTAAKQSSVTAIKTAASSSTISKNTTLTTKSSGSSNASGTSTTSSGNSSGSSAAASSTQESSGKLYRDGTYEGSGEGFRGGTTTVSVSVKSDKITDIGIVSYMDDEPFFNRACSTVISEIKEAQSTDVDTVSGATFSSMGIMSAVADALGKAGL